MRVRLVRTRKFQKLDYERDRPFLQAFLMGRVGIEPATKSPWKSSVKKSTRLLGSPPELFANQALLKPQLIGREKPSHQDHAFFNVPIGTRIVGC
jgi:hypothetical protein